jgi:uncharacterized membrane protein
MAACAKCGADLKEGATFCGSCGAPVAAAAGAAPASGGGAPAGATPSASSGGLTPNVAGALAYLTIIPAIIFLVMEPYNKDKFIRFHAFQCLFVAAASFVIFFGLGIFSLIPIVGWILGLLLMPLLGLAIFCLILFTMYKAYNNEKFKLPVIGNLAEQQADK